MYTNGNCNKIFLLRKIFYIFLLQNLRTDKYDCSICIGWVTTVVHNCTMHTIRQSVGIQSVTPVNDPDGFAFMPSCPQCGL